MFVIQKILLKPIAIDKLNATNSGKQKGRHFFNDTLRPPQPTSTHEEETPKAERACFAVLVTESRWWFEGVTTALDAGQDHQELASYVRRRKFSFLSIASYSLQVEKQRRCG